LAATRPGSVFDHGSRLVSTAGVSLPTFFTGLLLIYVFYFKLGWAPPPMGRLDSFTEAPRQITGFLLLDSLLARNLSVFWSSAKQLALPAVTLALFAMAPLSRMTRAAMLSVLSSDYIRTARASGLSRFQVLVVYGFRNALLPVLTTLGMVFSFLLGANVLVEKVFAWPGLGSFALEALISSDYAPVQGFVLVMGTVYVMLNLLIDVLYGLVDPRAKVAA
ncbi:MAG TPA: ABC transporter permease, partial [Polyangia bacterium]